MYGMREYIYIYKILNQYKKKSNQRIKKKKIDLFKEE